MSKFINLDEFTTKAQKQLQYEGKTYDIRPLGVGAYIEILNKRQKFEELGEDVNLSDIYELTVSTVKQCVDMPDEDIEKMTIPQLMALAKFVQEADEDTKEVETEMGN